MTVELYPSIAALPHFNPDLDVPGEQELPPSVAELRALVGRADGLLLSTPEYAHGLPGSFKNALDWLVGSVEFPGKAVAVITPTTRSVHAQAQLWEVLTTMSARLIGIAPMVVPLFSRSMDADAVSSSAALASLLRATLTEIAGAIDGGGSPASASASL